MKSTTKITCGLFALSLFALPLISGTSQAMEGQKNHHNVFKKMDADKDGKISEDEHLAGAKERFAKMDVDGDGFVTKEEADSVKEKMRAKWKEHKEKKNADKAAE